MPVCPSGHTSQAADYCDVCGTPMNGAPEPIPVNVPVPVGDGDRIHVGAWTTITLSLQEGDP